jgi:alpha-mannosidase
MQVDSPNVVLVTWKRAENQQGTILRFIETAGAQGTVSLTTP